LRVAHLLSHETPRRPVRAQVAGAAEPELWRQLPPPFAELWLRWAAEAGGGGAADRAATDDAARLAFARSLLGQPGGDAGSGRDAAAAGAGSAAGAVRAGGDGDSPAEAPAAADAEAQPAARASLTREQEQARDFLLWSSLGRVGASEPLLLHANTGAGALSMSRCASLSSTVQQRAHLVQLRRRSREAAQECVRARERLHS